MGKQKEVKARYGWEINPKTRIKESKKEYNRNAFKKELKEYLNNDEDL